MVLLSARILALHRSLGTKGGRWGLWLGRWVCLLLRNFLLHHCPPPKVI